MMTLTDSQRAILAAAAQQPERLAFSPVRLPAGARQSVAKALLRQGLVIASPGTAHNAAALWTVDGSGVALQITEQGLNALAPDAAAQRAPAAEAAAAPLAAPQKPAAPQAGERVVSAAITTIQLREAATALLEAWDTCPAHDSTDNPISRAVEALRAALKGRQHRPSRIPGVSRQGTKQETVLTLLRRPEGATIAQVMEATSWQQHTVRGFFAGLKKRQGINVRVMERVRQVGPGAQGSRGSHSIYTVAP